MSGLQRKGNEKMSQFVTNIKIPELGILILVWDFKFYKIHKFDNFFIFVQLRMKINLNNYQLNRFKCKCKFVTVHWFKIDMTDSCIFKFKPKKSNIANFVYYGKARIHIFQRMHSSTLRKIAEQTYWEMSFVPYSCFLFFKQKKRLTPLGLHNKM